MVHSNAHGRRVVVVDAQNPESLARALAPEPEAPLAAPGSGEPTARPEFSGRLEPGDTLTRLLLRYYQRAGGRPDATAYANFCEWFLGQLPLNGFSNQDGVPALVLASGEKLPLFAAPEGLIPGGVGYRERAYGAITPGAEGRPRGVPLAGMDNAYGAITGS